MKNFTVITKPPDALIKVASGVERRERQYVSPAIIATEVPEDPIAAAAVKLVVSRNDYKPAIIPLRHISNGDVIRIELEKIISHRQPAYSLVSTHSDKHAFRIRYRLLAPTLSDKLKSQLGRHLLVSEQPDEIKYQDQSISISFSVKEQSFELHLTNLSSHPLKILWDRAEYIDIYAQRRRLMHSGIRYQDRNNPIPPQIVSPGSSIQETIMPIEHVFVSPQTGGYEIKPLFNRKIRGASELAGKTFLLFIPIEINRAIVPYNFKIGIVGGPKVAAKD